MLINEEPQWSTGGLLESDYQMFPELGELDEDVLMPPDDFLESLSADLEIPLLLNGEGSPSYDESPDEIMKTALESPQRTLEEFGLTFMKSDSNSYARSPVVSEIPQEIQSNVKLEPQSPRAQLPLSPSPSHSESSGSEWINETTAGTAGDVKFAFETPPISPPQNESPPISPRPAYTNLSTNGQPIKFVTVSSQESPKFICVDGNPAKRICIQPKLDKTLVKNENPRKTIVLSAQDFAALTQRVKHNNLSQPLKVQALPMNRHAKLHNQVNLLPVHATKPKAIPITTNQVKIINAIPGIQIHNAKVKTESTPIVLKKEVAATCATPTIVIKTEPEYVDLNERQESEIKAMKRQQRMIKNRESACLSRKKKKEYVTALENQISELQEQNRQLQMENAELHQRLSDLEELSSKKFTGFNVEANRKNAAILLAMVFMVSLNFGGFGGVFSQKKELINDVKPHVPLSLSNVRHGRTLLWSESSEDQEEQAPKESFNDTLPPHHPMCPMHINQTESNRLDDALRRWIGGVDSGRANQPRSPKTELEIKAMSDDRRPKGTSLLKNSISNMKLLLKKRSEDYKQKKNLSSPENNAVEVFSPMPMEHSKLFDALGRNEDTFYVVWFTGQHLLLPASRKNNTTRPKMSLVLPAVSVNGNFSTPPNHVTMMQIECEVTNTQLLQIQESLIPKNLHERPKAAPSSPKPEASTSSNVVKNYKPYFIKSNSTGEAFKVPYNREETAPYLEKPILASDVEMDEMKYNVYETLRRKNSNNVMNETEDTKSIYSQNRKVIRKKLKRAAT